MKIYKNIIQYSDEYWRLRQGRLTASNASTVANNGNGLKSYVISILADKYSNNHDSYKSKDMIRGTELEPYARDTYEIETGNKVEQVGMITEGKYVSCSPDGLIGKDIGLEIKCVNKVKYFKLLVNGEKEIEKKHWWQCQFSLMVSKRKYWHLTYYHPDFEKSLTIFKIKPNEEAFAKLKEGIKRGIELLKEYDKKFKKLI